MFLIDFLVRNSSSFNLLKHQRARFTREKGVGEGGKRWISGVTCYSRSGRHVRTIHLRTVVSIDQFRGTLILKWLNLKLLCLSMKWWMDGWKRSCPLPADGESTSLSGHKPPAGWHFHSFSLLFSSLLN